MFSSWRALAHLCVQSRASATRLVVEVRPSPMHRRGVRKDHNMRLSLKGNPLEKCKWASPIFLVWQHRTGTESTLSLCRLGIQHLSSHRCSLHKKGQTQGNHRAGSCHQPQQVHDRQSRSCESGRVPKDCISQRRLEPRFHRGLSSWPFIVAESREIPIA